MDASTIALLVRQNEDRRRVSDPSASSGAYWHRGALAILDERDAKALDLTPWVLP